MVSHWSPLEMAHVVFEIVTSRAIARQLLRHRSFSFQEFSQRYSDEIEFQPLQAARLQDKKNRQSSIEHDDETLQVWWEREQDMAIRESETRYIEALSLGIAKECARVVLPEGLTTSRLYMAGSLRSWFHYCELRTGNGTQLEHQEIALAIQDILVEEFPSIFISQKKGTM